MIAVWLVCATWWCNSGNNFSTAWWWVVVVLLFILLLFFFLAICFRLRHLESYGEWLLYFINQVLSSVDEMMLTTLPFKTESKLTWMFLQQYSFDIQPWKRSLLAHGQLSWAIVVSILCSSCDPAEIPFGPIWKDMSDDGSNHLASKIRNWWQAH